jgi:hypothetical protein
MQAKAKCVPTISRAAIIKVAATIVIGICGLLYGEERSFAQSPNCVPDLYRQHCVPIPSETATVAQPRSDTPHRRGSPRHRHW